MNLNQFKILLKVINPNLYKLSFLEKSLSKNYAKIMQKLILEK